MKIIETFMNTFNINYTLLKGRELVEISGSDGENLLDCLNMMGYIVQQKMDEEDSFTFQSKFFKGTISYDTIKEKTMVNLERN